MSRPRLPLLVASTLITVALAVRSVPVIQSWNETRRARAAVVTRELAARRASAVRVTDRQQVVAAQRDMLRKTERWLFPPVEAALADAALARRLEQAASKASATLISVQPLPADTARSGFRVLRARATIVGDLEALTFFLAEIEDEPARIVVRELTLSQPDMSLPRSRLETVRGEVVVEGLMASPAARVGR